MQMKQVLLSKKRKQNRSSNRIHNKGERKFLQAYLQRTIFLYHFQVQVRDTVDRHSLKQLLKNSCPLEAFPLTCQKLE